MKLRVLMWIALAAGCGKTNDVNAIQDEANGVVATYKPIIERLELRDRRLGDRQRIDPFPQDVALHKATANARLVAMRNELNAAPGRISNAATGDGARIALVKAMNGLQRSFSTGTTLVNAELDAIESWLAHPRVAAVAPTPTPTPAPTPTDPPAPEPEAPAPAPGP